MQRLDKSALDRWVTAGLIDDATREAIERFEAERAGREPRTVSALVEVLIYLGAASGVGALIAALNGVWDDIGTTARVAALAVAAVAAGIAAWAVRGEGGAQARAATVLQIVSVGFAAAAGGVAVADSDLMAIDGTGPHTLLIGAVTSAAALAHHARRPGVVQLVVLSAALSTLAVGVVTLFSSPSANEITLAVIVVGVGIVALDRAEVVRPRGTAVWLGPAVVLAALHVSAWTEAGLWAEVVGIVASIGVLGASITQRSSSVLAVGAAGLFTFLPGAIIRHLSDSVGAPLALFIAAVVLIGAGVTIARLRPMARGAGPGSKPDPQGS